MGMAKLLLNFGEMRFEGTFDEFEITLSEVPDLPDMLRYAIQGAVKGLAEFVLDGSISLDSRMVGSSTIVYAGVNLAKS